MNDPNPQPDYCNRLRYLKVFATFARNSLVRDMTFRTNFFIQSFSSLAWMGINLCYYILIFSFTDELGQGTGWGRYEFFVFIATGMIVNSLMGAFILPNAEAFSELIRLGDLDFVLLKPIDTQFLISFNKVVWSSLSNTVFGIGLLSYSLIHLDFTPGLFQIICYPLYILCGIGILYSVIICLAASSIWMGRNQNLYNFWFYLTNFSRYPIEIYRGKLGMPFNITLTYIIPILIAINVPARFMAKPMTDEHDMLAVYALFATVVCLVVSRRVFQASLKGYRSASS